MSVDIADTIEPGSTEYGDRQVLEDQMRQINEQSRNRPVPAPGAVSQRTQQRLENGPTSDLPVTAGLSVGPGPGPSQAGAPAEDPRLEKYRLIATQARNPYLRHLARNNLRALTRKGL